MPYDRATREEPKKGSQMTLHAHGDGTYHTTTDSWGPSDSRVDHESFGAAVMHMAKHHAPADEDHMHISAHDDGYTTHHVMEGGKVQGPHEHSGVRELKRHLSNTICQESD